MSPGDDFLSKLFVLRLAIEGELVSGFTIGHLVDFEPLYSSLKKYKMSANYCSFISFYLEESWHYFVHVVDIIEVLRKRIGHINTNHFPVRLTLVYHRKDSEDLDLDDGASGLDLVAYLAHVNWVIIPLAVGRFVGVVGIFPGLRDSAVVPDVAVVREAVGHKPQLALLHVLLEGVEGRLGVNLDLGIAPSWDLDHHIVDTLTCINWSATQF